MGRQMEREDTVNEDETPIGLDESVETALEEIRDR